MNVQKFRNFVITEFVKSGIHCTFAVPVLGCSEPKCIGEWVKGWRDVVVIKGMVVPTVSLPDFFSMMLFSPLPLCLLFISMAPKSAKTVCNFCLSLRAKRLKSTICFPSHCDSKMTEIIQCHTLPPQFAVELRYLKLALNHCLLWQYHATYAYEHSKHGRTTKDGA